MQTRDEILREYETKDGRITSPGKFEGEPVFAPHFWDCALEGFADKDDGSVFTFILPAGDAARLAWPELRAWLGRKRTLQMREDDQGFVHCF